MKVSIQRCLAGLILASLPVIAQQQQQQAKGPHPKNQQELEALQKAQAAMQGGDPDAQLAAIDNVLTNFTNTDFKPILYSWALQAAQQKNDYAVITTWTQRAIQNDPNDAEAYISLAESTARHTRENDLDKADSIKKVQDNANKGLDLLKTQTSPPPGMQDAQWAEVKKQLTGQAYEALAQAATLDKKYPDAVSTLKTGIAADPSSSVLKARLAKAYVDNKQYDDAITTADLVINDANAQPVVKQFAQGQKDLATKLKGTK
jgi:tetratricopeptide (TPR) repeat protein